MVCVDVCFVQIRPAEGLAPVQINPVGEALSAAYLGPGLRKGLGQQGKDAFVFPVFSGCIRAVQIPEAEVDEDAALRGLAGEGGASVDIIFQISSLVGLEGLQGEVDLVQAGHGQQGLPCPVQEGAVGRQDDPEALFVRQGQETGQLRVQEGFAHQVKVEIFRPVAQAVQDRREFGLSHKMRGTSGFRAEGAAAVADVGDLDVGLGKAHGGRLLYCLFRYSAQTRLASADNLSSSRLARRPLRTVKQPFTIV